MSYYKAQLSAVIGTPSSVKGDTLADLKDGFWINSKKEFTKAQDSKFWIPQSQILYIEKCDES